MGRLTRWIAAQFDGGLTVPGAAIAVLLTVTAIGALLALAGDMLILAACLGATFLVMLAFMFVSTRFTSQPIAVVDTRLEKLTVREQLLTNALCLAWAGAGFLVGAGLVHIWPWPIYGNVLTALVIGVALGVPEILVIRRYFQPAARLLCLNNEPFPFAALGVAGAVIVFGLH
jgi:hypothetical protein